MKKHNVRIFGLFVLCFVAVTSIALTASYLPDQPGFTEQLSGTVTTSDGDHPISKTIKVLEPVKEDSSELIVHEITIHLQDKNEKKVKYYEVKPDGVYWVAESDAPGKGLKKLKTPVLVFPKPLVQGKKWDVTYKSGLKSFKITYSIESLNEPVKIGDKTYNTLHIHSEGESKVFTLKIPLKSDSYYVEGLGLVKEVTVQTVQKRDMITTLKLTSSTSEDVPDNARKEKEKH